jgi:hypothetical protein
MPWVRQRWFAVHPKSARLMKADDERREELSDRLALDNQSLGARISTYQEETPDAIRAMRGYERTAWRKAGIR